MDIQQLHIENNAYRDLINDLKRKIAHYDKRIAANEIAIGQQLEGMHNDEQHLNGDCMLCMGWECI